MKPFRQLKNKKKGRIWLYLMVLLLGVSSCGISKKSIQPPSDGKETTSALSDPADQFPKIRTRISENAQFFMGAPYKYGGTNKKGIDCSGLIYLAFNKENIDLPRTSRELSLLGHRLYLKEVQTGDLLFFETNKNRKVINHVGLVVEITPRDIFFIHSTTSKGVIISSLNNKYWNEHFVMARRVL